MKNLHSLLPSYRKCSMCLTTKKLEHFGRDLHKPLGRDYRCHKCHLRRIKKYRESNRKKCSLAVMRSYKTAPGILSHTFTRISRNFPTHPLFKLKNKKTFFSFFLSNARFIEMVNDYTKKKCIPDLRPNFIFQNAKTLHEIELITQKENKRRILDLAHLSITKLPNPDALWKEFVTVKDASFLAKKYRATLSGIRQRYRKAKNYIPCKGTGWWTGHQNRIPHHK